jgi:hypothetical protein
LNVVRTLSELSSRGLLEQSLHGAREAQGGEHEEDEPDDAMLALVAEGDEKMSVTASAPPPVRS